jgi:hypothetical protein
MMGNVALGLDLAPVIVALLLGRDVEYQIYCYS